MFTNGTYNADWFGVKYDHYWATNTSLHYRNNLDSFPIESKAGLFYREGIGYTTNLTVEEHYPAEPGFVDGGDAWYTRQPATTIDWLLSETHYTSNGFEFVDVGALDTRLYEEIKPVVRYLQGGTNALSAVSLTIQGSALVLSNQSTVATSEVVSVSATNTACTVQWYDITNITSASTSANTGDTYSVIYTNEIVLYGDRPYRLYATDLDERAAVLGALTATLETSCSWTYTNDCNAAGVDLHGSSWAAAKAGAIADYSTNDAARAPVSSSWLEYDDDPEYAAALDGAINKCLVSGLSTTITHTVNIYVDSRARFLIDHQDYTNSLNDFDYDDGSLGLPENQVSRWQRITNATPTATVLSDEAGSLAVAPWPTSNPPLTNDAMKVRGFEFEDPQAIIEWDFD